MIRLVEVAGKELKCERCKTKFHTIARVSIPKRCERCKRPLLARDVTVQGRECTCEQCGVTWVSVLPHLPTRCSMCHSIRWNGDKQRGRPKLIAIQKGTK